MSKKVIQEQTLIDIANAIRLKKSSSNPIQVSDFATEIESISGGGGRRYDYDFSKFNFLTKTGLDTYVIGGLTFEDLVVSNFTSNDYMLQTSAFVSAKPWEINVKFKINEVKTTTIFGSWGNYWYGPNLELQSTSLIARYSTDGSSWELTLTIPNIIWEVNTWYRVKVQWTRTQYILFLYDEEENLLGSASDSMTTAHYLNSDNTKSCLEFGGIARAVSYISSNLFIDLRYTNIIENNEIVWGIDIKELTPFVPEEIDYSKLNFTNNTGYFENKGPVFTGLEVAGFNNSNSMIQTPIYLKNNPWKISAKFKISSFSQKSIICGANGNFYHNPSIEIQSPTQIWAGYSTNGSTWDNSIMITDVPSLDTNTWYIIEYQWTGTQIILSIYDENYTLIKTGTKLELNPCYAITTEGINSSCIEFGGIANSSNHNSPYLTLDLSHTYIQENNIVIWGAEKKEKRN